MTNKEKILAVIERLPDDVSVDLAVYELYLLKKIDTGLAQADAGDVIAHEDFKKQMLGGGQ